MTPAALRYLTVRPTARSKARLAIESKTSMAAKLTAAPIPRITRLQNIDKPSIRENGVRNARRDFANPKRPRPISVPGSAHDCGVCPAVRRFAAETPVVTQRSMRIVIPACLAALLTALPAAAELSPKSIEFLKEIGIDPESPIIKAVADDAVPDRQGKPMNLEELALHKNALGIRRFVATRNFLR